MFSMVTLFAVDLVMGGEIQIESFANPTHTWTSHNDPVMGGKSTGAVSVSDGVGIFDGEVVDVPFLKAPGFITMQTRGGSYPDVSSCDALKLTIMSTKEYQGYQVSFGVNHAPGAFRHASGYKAHFDAPVGEFGDVIIPFTSFSNFWDAKTGNQMVTCEENKDYCPDEATLKDLKQISVWGEGVAGMVHLEIKSIDSTGCSEEVTELEITELELGSFPSSDPEGNEIIIESFANPAHSWKSKNDPVMGGESTGSVSVENGVGIFYGEVVDVPFLKAPGFITMATSGGEYPDASSCDSLKLTVMAKEAYEGYRISFGNAHVRGGRFAFGYKADFDPPVGEFGDVIIPFHEFSDKWDDATGDQIVTCEEDSRYCPDMKTLKNMKTISIWGEGVNGTVNLEVKSISAVGCVSDGKVLTNPMLRAQWTIHE
eukprot:CAMPEP_0195511498 /NCGR_PEP_ID=MMETSP0794_2-20130614/3784_1 /TAXON_ID=515487 /ORGANISM="Stephanopyxis turris, Strain CCMP 815" /LENGTH=426 /DNA_ID=CAMNT_0040639099 /DNA_START=241 /DNA_END=1521 /DNA_ORIENTATION=+